MEAAGIEPASENIRPESTTCLVFDLGLASGSTQRPVEPSASFGVLAAPPEAQGGGQPANGHLPPAQATRGRCHGALGREG